MVPSSLKLTPAASNADLNVNHPFYFRIIKNECASEGITIFSGSVKSI